MILVVAACAEPEPPGVTYAPAATPAGHARAADSVAGGSNVGGVSAADVHATVPCLGDVCHCLGERVYFDGGCHDAEDLEALLGKSGFTFLGAVGAHEERDGAGLVMFELGKDGALLMTEVKPRKQSGGVQRGGYKLGTRLKYHVEQNTDSTDSVWFETLEPRDGDFEVTSWVELFPWVHEHPEDHYSSSTKCYCWHSDAGDGCGTCTIASGGGGDSCEANKSLMLPEYTRICQEQMALTIAVWGSFAAPLLLETSGTAAAVSTTGVFSTSFFRAASTLMKQADALEDMASSALDLCDSIAEDQVEAILNNTGCDFDGYEDINAPDPSEDDGEESGTTELGGDDCMVLISDEEYHYVDGVCCGIFQQGMCVGTTASNGTCDYSSGDCTLKTDIDCAVGWTTEECDGNN